LELVAFFVGDGWGGFFLPRELQPLCNYWYWVFASHAVVGVVCDESGLFPSSVVASVVAFYYPSRLPELNLIQELVPR
jgi:hypothetical protein